MSPLPLAALLALSVLVPAPPAAAQSGESACGSADGSSSGVFAYNPNFCYHAKGYYVYKRAGQADIVCDQEFDAWCRVHHPEIAPPSKTVRTPGVSTSSAAKKRAAAKKPARKPALKPEQAAKPLTDDELALLTDAERAAYQAGGSADEARALAQSRVGYKAPSDRAAYDALNEAQRALFCDGWSRSVAASSGGVDKKALDQAKGAKTNAGSEMEGRRQTVSAADGAGGAWQSPACKGAQIDKPAAVSTVDSRIQEPPSPKTAPKTSAKPDNSAPDDARLSDGKTAGPEKTAAVPAAPEKKASRGLLGELVHDVKAFFKWLF